MPKLFMVQLGARPKGRLIEQHDMFFGVADQLVDLIPAINHHWPEVKNKWHIDAYRKVSKVGDYKIEWVQENCTESNQRPIEPLQTLANKLDNQHDNTKHNEAKQDATEEQGLKLFFINLGGYLPNDFEEYHHKLLIVAGSQAEAIKQAKQSTFYKKFTFKDKQTPFNAASHVDDKHQLDSASVIDEIYPVEDLLATGRLKITRINKPGNQTDYTEYDNQSCEDKLFVGYLSLQSLTRMSENGL